MQAALGFLAGGREEEMPALAPAKIGHKRTIVIF
jgi:hypothetical protein